MTRRSVAVIQARMTSSRLPGKVLLPLAGHPVLWHVVERARRIPGLDGIAVAIPDGDGQGPLAAFVDGLPDVMLLRGPEDDVLSRYIHAAEESRAEILLRITSDCPVIDPGIAGSGKRLGMALISPSILTLANRYHGQRASESSQIRLV